MSLKQFVLRIVPWLQARWPHVGWGGQMPIRELGLRHRPRLLKHLFLLNADDRFSRFGYAATDAHIQHYVNHIDFERDVVLGIFNRRLQLIATAHLTPSRDPKSAACAEFGVSVLPHWRGKDLGTQLFERAVLVARNHGVAVLFVQALSDNAPMLKIVRKAGAVVERYGSETEAYIYLPIATLGSRVDELIDEQRAQINYQFKLQAKHFAGFLNAVREVRTGVQKAKETVAR